MSLTRHRVAVVTMVLNENGHILLVNDARRGWEFPGGLVETGESVKDAAIREVLEETGIMIELKELRLIGQDVAAHKFVFLFLARSLAGTLCPGDETLEVGYFTISEALAKLALKPYNSYIVRCLDPAASPFLVEYTD